MVSNRCKRDQGAPRGGGREIEMAQRESSGRVDAGVTRGTLLESLWYTNGSPESAAAHVAARLDSGSLILTGTLRNWLRDAPAGFSWARALLGKE